MTSRPDTTVKNLILGREVDFPSTRYVWTHVKTGGRYRVISPCVIEDGAVPAVAYQLTDGSGPVWIRPLAEFMDGRFSA
jgi:hypothetical protein